ncbi:MAG: DNA-directed RNA polymerase subunit RpoH/Rpb5 C-terminal domain-containing protein [Candidatus ainarchaeum sp.]|nr:DNA-directed RNA polymerase subunit RpoH/Rpb5 C-terminal domain-containing protein [Candidatus ainarchaeum sp.]MDD3975956.1 DNA-directed RNA polymerase subunit RpoH/Rpb5 C-terminal domain-containing protein [Candidatus ainarchaeum sp.]
MVKKETKSKKVFSKEEIKDVEILDITSSKSKTKEKKEPKEKAYKKKNRRERRLKDQVIHSYIPEHRILDQEEVLKLSEKDLSSERMPIIFISDKAIRHLEVKVGDIIEIKRKNSNVGETLYYRRVVKD